MAATLDKKQKFLELRANNESYDGIAKKLGVSKTTLISWSKELQTDLINLKTINTEAMLNKYKVGKEHSLQLWTEQLKAIREELNQRGYKDVPTLKLIELLELLNSKIDKEAMPIVFISEEYKASAFDNLSTTNTRDRWQG